MREGEVEPDPVPADASVVARELDQLAAHAVDMVQPREPGDRFVFLLERLHEPVDEQTRPVRRTDQTVLRVG